MLISAGALGLVSCQGGDREVSVTERRELVMFDNSYLDDIKDAPPSSWRRIPWTPMRYYNYRFGEDEGGEVWLSVIPARSSSALLQNINRWYGQFGLSPVTDLEGLQHEEMLGTTGYVVEADGTYQAGMGAEPREGVKMLAAAIPSGGNVVTVKMVGTPEQVEGEREAFLAYCKTLEVHDVLTIPDPDSQ